MSDKQWNLDCGPSNPLSTMYVIIEKDFLIFCKIFFAIVVFPTPDGEEIIIIKLLFAAKI